MLKIYLTITWRTLLKHKAISLIMIIGLSLSMAAFMLITRYVFDELSFDEFHQHADRIYRINLHDYKNKVLTNSSAISYHAEGPAIKESIPEVEDFVRLHRAEGMINYRKADGEVVSFQEKNGFYADASFFKVFSFPLIKGYVNQVLQSPQSVVVSASMAKKYFGQEDPIGKVLQLTSEWQGGNYIVSGVFADVPDNSHFHFDFIFAIQNLLKNDQFVNGGWYWTNFYTYLLLKPDAKVGTIENSIATVIEKHLGRLWKRYNIHQTMTLQPIREIHLHSLSNSEIEPGGKMEILYVLIVVALLILAIGWLNYINLSTVMGMERGKEVGIRKTLGSEKKQLIGQFLLESFIFNLLALLIGIGLFLMATQVITQSDFAILSQPVFYLAIIAVFCLGFVLSGIYPALALSSFKPMMVLKGSLSTSSSGKVFRKGLVIFQFSASIMLIISTIVINQQMKFMQKQDLGMSIDQKLIINTPKILRTGSFTNDVTFFKDRILSNTGVKNVTASSSVPGREIFWTSEYQRFHEAANTFKLCHMVAIDEDFIPAYEMKILAGRNFVKEMILDDNAVIINETAMKAFGFSTPESALNQEIGDALPKNIVGVIKDFHQESLKSNTKPIVFQHIPWNSTYLTLTLQSKDIKNTLFMVEEIYKNAFPNNAFEYFFLDTYFQQQYEADERLAKLFNWFAGLAIYIACLGLLGLAMFTARSRTKEIGIRKVLGATVGSIAILLSKDFLKPVLWAVLIASPLAWYAIHWWLQGFAYRVPIRWWVFVAGGMTAILIALLTISFHSIKSALMNPVKTLKIE
ncbi:ABC transporter permease [Emticicia sp. BO119]|uniref:ABC transporter permease n=1 Tax=Emticicia sp. BO119 TaxID=2757768 RepID=UPI0015F030CC|nr:ABC transporter permease [Emticicia sp. BO119]MBA4850657.1 ABC transporter permease [Emticicia sp. BO119]